MPTCLDDYDSEFRFEGERLPPLASLDADRVVYLGSMYKVLTPTLRCGFFVAPKPLAERLAEWKGMVDGALSWSVQQLVLHLLEAGELKRHVRRMHTHSPGPGTMVRKR